MSKEICISSTPHETRLAILEDDQLAEIYYERENEYTLAGSIYKGRVTRVLPGMQSAFVEVGLERDAFLYVTDFLEEQGDSADFERVAAGAPRRDSAADQTSDLNSDSNDAEPQAESGSSREAHFSGTHPSPAHGSGGQPSGAQSSREGQQRSRRGRNRGRGGERGQSGRPDSQPVAPQGLSIEPFDSAGIAPTAQFAPHSTESISPQGPQAPMQPAHNESGDDESQEGTRRWRGRRGRRSGSRQPDPREQSTAATPRQPISPAAAPRQAFTEQGPAQERVGTINAAQSSSFPTPIVLPGESLSKYGHAPQGAAPAPASSRHAASVAPYPVTAQPPTQPSTQPSTLIQAPLSWDGSSLFLPGETISRYRKPESMAKPAGSQVDPLDQPSAGHGPERSTEQEQSTEQDQSNARPGSPEFANQATEEPAVGGLAPGESAQHSPFEAAYQAPEAHYPDAAQPVLQVIEEETVETHEEVEFNPEKAEASHRIDPSAPSEFRVSSTAEEAVEEEPEPVAFQSVLPETSGNYEVEREEASQQLEQVQAEEAAASEPQHESRAEEPHHESLWQVVKELVTGHSSTTEHPPAEGIPQQEHHPDASTAIEASAADAPEQSLALRYEEKREEAETNAAPDDFVQGLKEPEPVSEQMSEAGHHLTEPSHLQVDSPAKVLDGFSVEMPLGAGEEEETSQGFAPGSGLIEEETIEEEEYDYEPIHAGTDDHDLEDLEEETLESQAGVELGDMVREAHLEQRVKNFNGESAGEETDEAYGDASGGFTEEDFDKDTDLEGDEEGEEEDQPAIGQAASPSPGGPRRDNRNAGRDGSGRSDRSRGRGRRPGGAGAPHRGGRHNTQASDLPVISELLKQGQEILVQIAKEPIAKKGARITSHIALPGRFLVFMPTVNHVGVSRKISSDEERQRLKRILISEKGAAGGGFIVRTAADGASEEDLRADIRFLLALWNEIKQRSDEAKAPALIYHDLNLIERVLRDQVSDNFTAIWVDSETEYERIVRFLQRFQPSLVRRVKLYTKETPLFEQFGIQEEISKALKSKVWLKSGGSIVINQTEALVAIDINTGKFVGKTTRLEDTILRTNLDAIPEIVRQIRLRDLGGIIVIDFIDMDERKNRNRVLQALEDELKHDRAPSKVLPFNDFGLIAITRKRVKQSLERTLSVQCEICTGTGMVKSPTTVCNEIYTEMRKMYRALERKDVLLRVHPEVVKSLKSTNGRWLNELEEMTGKTIIVKSDPALHPEQFDIH